MSSVYSRGPDGANPNFGETLRSLGYDQGTNLRLLLRSAAGKPDRLPALARELVDARVDVIVAINSPGSSVVLS
jgi:ABC-type uncharacterized transport system substrate-binding protein